MNEEAFNGTVRVPRPVALIRAFGQQELPGFFADAKEKRPVCCAANAGLHFSELDLKHFFKRLRLKGRKTTSLSNRRKLFAKPACTISSIVSATCEVSPRQWKAPPVCGHRCQKLHTDFLVILLLSARPGSYVLRGHAFTRTVLRPAGGHLNALLIVAICEVAGEDALGGAFARPACC